MRTLAAVFGLSLRVSQLYIMEAKNFTVNMTGGIRERGIGMLHQLSRAALLSGDLPDIEFSLVVGDVGWANGTLREGDEIPKLALWSFSRRLGDEHYDPLWLVPDFNFRSWTGVVDSYPSFRKAAAAPDVDVPVKERTQKMIWRGNPLTNPTLREALLNVTRDKPWADVQPIAWEDDHITGPAVSMPDHCRYALNVHTEGVSWSGRLKFLLNCHAVTAVHSLEWRAFYYHLLKFDGAKQNVVATKRDFSDLETTAQQLLGDSEKMQRIADNGAAMFRDRYLTPAAVSCYWRQLFRSYAEVAFVPSKEGDQGVAFEQYM